jgi:hypothetical protein
MLNLSQGTVGDGLAGRTVGADRSEAVLQTVEARLVSPDWARVGLVYPHLTTR